MIPKNDGFQPARSLTVTLTIVFFVFSLAILLTVGGVTFVATYSAYREIIFTRQLLTAQNASKTIASSIQEKFSVLETAVEFSNPDTESGATRLGVLENLLGLQPSFRQLTLLNETGAQLASISRLSSSLSLQFNARVEEESLFAQVRQGQRYISPIYIDDLTSEPLVVIAVPATNVFGDFQGVLAAELNLKFMWELVDQLKVGETGYVYVTDNQGRLIAFNDTARVLSNENVGHIFEVAEFLKDPSATSDITPEVETYQGLKGSPVVGTYISLGTPEWAIVTELPTSEAYQEIYRYLLIGNILLVIFLAAAGLTGVFMSRRLTASLRTLAQVATDLAQGNFAVEAPGSGPAEIVQLASTFNAMASRLRELIGSLEQRVSERTSELEARTDQLAQISAHMQERAFKLQAVALVARTITSIQNINTLLPRVASVIGEQFNFYHVGIFLLDANKNFAVLTAANSAGGQKMLARQHRLKVGEVGIVGNVAESGLARIALDTGADAVFFNNPDLPNTRSEMALPLKVGAEVIGILDVQSERPAAFTDEDTELLTIVADQVSIAIQNARQFDATQEFIAEIETINRQYVRQEWKSVADTTASIGYRFTSNTGLESLSEPVESLGIAQATQSGKTNITETQAQNGLAIPIKLRGQVIGIVNVQSHGKHNWGQDEIDIAEAIAERVALASENARLLQTSQAQAARERTIGEITSRNGASVNLRNVLQTAVEELGRVMPGSEVVIQIESGNKK